MRKVITGRFEVLRLACLYHRKWGLYILRPGEDYIVVLFNTEQEMNTEFEAEKDLVKEDIIKPTFYTCHPAGIMTWRQ